MAATTLTGLTLIDGTGAAPVADAALSWDDDGRITYAGPAAGHVPTGAVHHLPGTTALPGFIDCHVHFAFTTGNPRLNAIRTDAAFAAFTAADRMRRTLDAGVTTVRDLGGLTAGFRDAQRAGLVTGPRLQTAVRVISHTGGHGDLSLPGADVHQHHSHLEELADDVAGVRLAARRILRDGADLIKVCATGGMGSPHDDPDDEGLFAEEMRAVAEELDRHGGGALAAHAQGTRGIRNAILGGVTSVEHGYGIDDESIDLMGERGTFLVPTLSTVFTPMDRSKVERYTYEKKTRWAEATKHNIARAIGRGVTVAMGTDSGVVEHGNNLRELAHLVTMGLSPLAALTAGTHTAARLLGIEAQTGSLRAGLLADVVLTRVDPLADIAALGERDRIDVVVQGGAVVKGFLTANGGY